MVWVYGDQIEPGGAELDDGHYQGKCPECGEPAAFRNWEACEAGTINQYYSIACAHCGHDETDWSDETDDWDLSAWNDWEEPEV